jgi:probable F420-dependent oxidoreductase
MLVTFAADDPGDWSHLIGFARAAEESGFDRLALSDHVVFGENLEAYGDPANGGARGGRQPTGPDGLWLEPLTTIAHLAAVTTRLRFATGILLAALRRPVVLAKMASTIDVLSGGRLDLGVGVGWQREEYQAAGLSFEGRGELLDRTIEICQLLWRNTRADYSDPDMSFAGIHQMPKPLQTGGVPVWVSGTVNPRAMDRLARYGSGWIPWGEDATHLATGISRMRSAMEERGRDPKDLGIVGSLRGYQAQDGSVDVDQTIAPVPELLSAGVTDFRIILRPVPGAEQTREILGVVGAAFREATT